MGKTKSKLSHIAKFLFSLLLLLTSPTLATEPPEVAVAKQKTYDAIDIRPFMDGINHWRKRYGRDRNDPLFNPVQIIHIAENILAYQNPAGRWPAGLFEKKYPEWKARVYGKQ